MKNWNKRQISNEEVRNLREKYGIDALNASILVRRGVTQGKDIQFYLEDSMRFAHSPFEFSAMEDVVDRILQAKDEDEIVMIFGDSDVDGITATTLLSDALCDLGIDVRCRLPSGNDPYGLNCGAIDDFEKESGSLIITVDCGISNVDEIAYATGKGIDVIVLDHHNPPEILPSPAIIIDPKCADSGYPFKDISGCAVAYKVAKALRFSQTQIYKNEISLLCASENSDGTVSIQSVKMQNLVEKERLSICVQKGAPLFETDLPLFLRGQQIFVWDAKKTLSILACAFGSNVDFEVFDFRNQAANLWKWAEKASLELLRSKSKFAVYNKDEDTEIGAFFNIFVSFCSQMCDNEKNNAQKEERDLQLVALAALADIMPLSNENRILVKNGVKSLSKQENVREGLRELFSLLGLLGKKITSTTLSWNVIPVLNATGRLRMPEVGLNLLLEKDSGKRQILAKKVIEMNEERKMLGTKAWEYGRESAEKSIGEHCGNLCVVADERIHRGVSGILAGKLVSVFNVPSIAITSVEDTAIGSMRSCRGLDATAFLDEIDKSGKDGVLFLSHGGHNSAAGFSFKKERLDEFLQIVRDFSKKIKLGIDESETFDVDAEIPEKYLTPSILDVAEKFEPYGEANRELLFMSKSLKIEDCAVVGKSEKQHLKLTFSAGGAKWPAIIWGGAEMLHRDFDKGNFVDILYNVGKNFYQGIEKPQLIIKDIRLSMQNS